MIKKIINIIARILGIKRNIFFEPIESKQSDAAISYAITVCNEAEDLQHLLDFIIPNLGTRDEIVVQADSSNVTKEVKDVVKKYGKHISTYVEHELNYDFARAKNNLNRQCKGEYIFQLDADECPHPWLMAHLRAIIAANPKVELFKLPRINLFYSKDGAHTRDYKHWPDYQGRVYKNIPERIIWKRPLHEKIRGHHTYTYLPKTDEYAIIHSKSTEANAKKWNAWKEHYKDLIKSE